MSYNLLSQLEAYWVLSTLQSKTQNGKYIEYITLVFIHEMFKIRAISKGTAFSLHTIERNTI